jgi:hypothetical protein
LSGFPRKRHGETPNINSKRGSGWEAVSGERVERNALKVSGIDVVFRISQLDTWFGVPLG